MWVAGVSLVSFTHSLYLVLLELGRKISLLGRLLRTCYFLAARQFQGTTAYVLEHIKYQRIAETKQPFPNLNKVS